MPLQVARGSVVFFDFPVAIQESLLICTLTCRAQRLGVFKTPPVAHRRSTLPFRPSLAEEANHSNW